MRPKYIITDILSIDVLLLSVHRYVIIESLDSWSVPLDPASTTLCFITI